VGRQGDLLGEHGITNDDQVFWAKAPSANRLPTGRPKLPNVALKAVWLR
jgi:hypothetical protein